MRYFANLNLFDFQYFLASGGGLLVLGIKIGRTGNWKLADTDQDHQ